MMAQMPRDGASFSRTVGKLSCAVGHNQLDRLMTKHREAMEIEFRDNPLLERTIPREMLEIIEAGKERRRGNG